MNNKIESGDLFGREIVEDVQRGEERAGYAKELLDRLSLNLNERFRLEESVAQYGGSHG
jgi:hypothetical protein